MVDNLLDDLCHVVGNVRIVGDKVLEGREGTVRRVGNGLSGKGGAIVGEGEEIVELPDGLDAADIVSEAPVSDAGDLGVGLGTSELR